MKLINITDQTDPRLELFSNIRERDLVSRDGYFIAEGKVVLSQLLVSKAFEASCILVLESRLAGIMPILQQAAVDLDVYVVSASVMDAISGFPMHRGILAIGKHRDGTAPVIPAYSHDALVVVMAGLSNHDNVGAVFRNAAAFNADAVILDDQCCDPLYRKSIRVSVGAVLKIPYLKGGTLVSIVDRLVQDGFTIAALSPGGTSSIVNFPKNGRRALVLGTEGAGLPAAILEKFTTWAIPIANDFDSLNVATASGIALFHASQFGYTSV